MSVSQTITRALLPWAATALFLLMARAMLEVISRG